MKTANGDNVLKAYAKAVKNIESDTMAAACSVTAGMLIPPGQKRGKRVGYQVFVKVSRYSDELLAKDPTSGGLMCPNVFK